MGVFFQVVLDGFVVFAINSIFGGLLFLLLRSYIRSRVEEWLEDELSGYFREQLSFAVQHADETAKTFAPIVNALLKEIMKDFERQGGGKPQTINLFGFKVPAEIANILIQRFLGGSNEKNINPFS